jgi:hypothetical protein
MGTDELGLWIKAQKMRMLEQDKIIKELNGLYDISDRDLLKRMCLAAEIIFETEDDATKFWSGTVDGREMYRVASGVTGLTIETVDWADHLTAGEIWFKLTH